MKTKKTWKRILMMRWAPSRRQQPSNSLAPLGPSQISTTRAKESQYEMELKVQVYHQPQKRIPYLKKWVQLSRSAGDCLRSVHKLKQLQASYWTRSTLQNPLYLKRSQMSSSWNQTSSFLTGRLKLLLFTRWKISSSLITGRSTSPEYSKG